MRNFRIIVATLDILTILILSLALKGICHIMQFNQLFLTSRELLLSIFCWVLSASIIGLYENSSVLEFINFIRRTFRTYVHYLFVFGAFSCLCPAQLSYTTLLIAFVITAFCVLIVRLFYFVMRRNYSMSGRFAKDVIIVSSTTDIKHVVDFFNARPQHFNLVGYLLTPELRKSEIMVNSKNLGSTEEIWCVCKENKVKDVFFVGSPTENSLYNRLYVEAQNYFIQVQFIPNLNMEVQRGATIYFYGNLPVLRLRQEPLLKSVNQWKKRLFDIIFSLFVIVFVFTWLFPLLIIMIKLNSKGPVFFIQQRTGMNGAVFSCIKFRSMVVNKDSDVRQATRNDDRYTSVGKFIRKTNLDELPQFFNVLFGDMTVVGPRPHMLKHTEQYSELIDIFMMRHWIKPGITGWAQVNGYRGETRTVTDMAMRVEYDIWYRENWSFYLDLKIIFLTVFRALRGDENAH